MPAQSAAQGRYFQAVRAIQEGKLNPKKVSPKMRETAKDISPAAAHDFAATKQKGLPEHVKESSQLINAICVKNADVPGFVEKLVAALGSAGSRAGNAGEKLLNTLGAARSKLSLQDLITPASAATGGALGFANTRNQQSQAPGAGIGAGDYLRNTLSGALGGAVLPHFARAGAGISSSMLDGGPLATFLGGSSVLNKIMPEASTVKTLLGQTPGAAGGSALAALLGSGGLASPKFEDYTANARMKAEEQKHRLEQMSLLKQKAIEQQMKQMEQRKNTLGGIKLSSVILNHLILQSNSEMEKNAMPWLRAAGAAMPAIGNWLSNSLPAVGRGLYNWAPKMWNQGMARFARPGAMQAINAGKSIMQGIHPGASTSDVMRLLGKGGVEAGSALEGQLGNLPKQFQRYTGAKGWLAENATRTADMANDSNRAFNLLPKGLQTGLNTAGRVGKFGLNWGVLPTVAGMGVDKLTSGLPFMPRNAARFGATQAINQGADMLDQYGQQTQDFMPRAQLAWKLLSDPNMLHNLSQQMRSMAPTA